MCVCVFVFMFVCMCVCACVCDRESERERDREREGETHTHNRTGLKIILFFRKINGLKRGFMPIKFSFFLFGSKHFLSEHDENTCTYATMPMVLMPIIFYFLFE